MMFRKLTPPRKEEVLAAALKLFIEKGYDKTKISDIANYLGVSYGLIYHYFKTKAGLFDIVTDDIIKDNLSIYEDIIDDAGLNPLEKLELMFLAYKKQPFDLTPLTICLYKAERSHEIFERVVKKKLYPYVDMLKKLIIEGSEEGFFNCRYPEQSVYFCIYGEMGIKQQCKGNTDELISIIEELYWQTLGIGREH